MERPSPIFLFGPPARVSRPSGLGLAGSQPIGTMALVNFLWIYLNQIKLGQT
jgi:hypothetical protein